MRASELIFELHKKPYEKALSIFRSICDTPEKFSQKITFRECQIGFT
jgi:hypothetical protein